METPTKPFNRPVPKGNKFIFYSTGTPELLLNGIEVTLEMSYNPDQCKTYLKSQLQGKIKDISKYDLIIYLAGGIPFLGGTLNDIYSKGNGPNVKFYIYGILTLPISTQQLNDKYPELCNVKDTSRRILLSPICDSTNIGLCNMACLLGYLNHDGVLWDKFLKSCSAVIHFPPFLTSLNRITERNDVTGRDVITVTSTLHTYFTSLLRPAPRPNEVFQYALKCCNYIININNDNETFPMKFIDVDEKEKIKEKDDDTGTIQSLQFLRNLNQPKIVYFWEGDTSEDYIYYTLQPFDSNDDDDDSEENQFLSFKPIAPLSIRVACGCAIVKGKDHCYFYISQSASKGAENSNKVDIIDPMEGVASSVDLEQFAIQQGNTKVDNSASLIDADRVKQVIFVCFDQSGSMNCPLGGHKEPVMPDTQTRAIIATQYLTSFANKTYGYRIPCVQGLIRFNNRIKESCPLSPLVPDFEEKGLKNLCPSGKTLLWDAISYACDRLVEFTKTSKGNKRFKNAVNRILVISDGEDTGSKMNLENVAKKMIDNNIIVDCVLVSTKEKCKELVTLCHITGGLAFNPKTTNEGLLLFEKSAFLCIEERVENNNPVINGDRKTRPKLLKSSQINADFIQKAIKDARFDTTADNKILSRAVGESRLASPGHICSINLNTKITQPRRRRILRELHYTAMITDKDSPDHDPNIIIYPFASCLDIWQVFLKGEDKTPYEGKWFFLCVTFPELYPVEPPVFRFISIPYHLNVSSEGRICLNILEKGYMPSRHVIDIIQMIKELFVVPSLENPVQIEILETFMEDLGKYNILARKSAQEVGKNDFKEFLPQRVSILDSVEKDFKFTFDKDHVPPYMISQISGRVIKDPVMASSGVYYERAELRQLVTCHKNPICYITGKPLTETANDLDTI